ncbi:hypothetical protein [Wolbachia endosymbiont of Ctenocephalides felis wCfeJ]|uniref:hypothetical protein n=1 Tax=Wolbachia endosymbiont of Ctenocephalides felis wCfeJ TaxID=2732594 RepID=UPI00144815C1|nr:hypothetical protein [Wolbachia endosymbiont of Ctenocephalides felis wCfeJ]
MSTTQIFAKEKLHILYDKESGLQLSLPGSMIVDNNNNVRTVYNNYGNDSLIKNARKIISFKFKDDRYYFIRADVLISKNDVSEKACYNSYPYINYESFSNNEGKEVPNEILIDGHYFTYLRGSDNAMSHLYGADTYRGIINGKCVFFDIYSNITSPDAYIDDHFLIKHIWSSFHEDMITVNNIIKNVKFDCH